MELISLKLRELFNTPGWINDTLSQQQSIELHEKIREMGKQVYKENGMEGLYLLHASVAGIPGAQRFTEHAFHGIGEWQA